MKQANIRLEAITPGHIRKRLLHGTKIKFLKKICNIGISTQIGH